jgi:hypothetical protein
MIVARKLNTTRKMNSARNRWLTRPVKNRDEHDEQPSLYQRWTRWTNDDGNEPFLKEIRALRGTPFLFWFTFFVSIFCLLIFFFYDDFFFWQKWNFFIFFSILTKVLKVWYFFQLSGRIFRLKFHCHFIYIGYRNGFKCCLFIAMRAFINMLLKLYFRGIYKIVAKKIILTVAYTCFRDGFYIIAMRSAYGKTNRCLYCI